MASKNPFDTFEIEDLPADLGHWRNAFDARFLRVSNLNGKPRTVRITNAQWLKSSNKNESKRQLLITLAEFEKPWAINVTNSETIGIVLGDDDPRTWVGKRVTIFPTKTKFGRDIVDCIRVKDTIPTDDRGATQASQAPKEKREIPPELQPYAARLREADSPDALVAIEDSLVEDNQLSAEHSAQVLRWIEKRRATLSATSG